MGIRRQRAGKQPEYLKKVPLFDKYRNWFVFGGALAYTIWFFDNIFYDMFFSKTVKNPYTEVPDYTRRIKAMKEQKMLKEKEDMEKKEKSL